MNVDISVVMPVYNAEKYLEESIESILNQTYKNFEFIIVNDGSTDDSLNIINYYAAEDNRIRVVSRENRGLVYSLNEGIKLARGEYIARMDADDISLSCRFIKQIKYIKKMKLDVCGTYAEVIGNNKNLIGMKEKEYNTNFSLYNLINGHALCHPSVILKKSAINCIGGYNDKYKYCEDLELWLRFIKNHYKIGVIPDRLIKYRVRLDSKSMIERNVALVDFINMRLDFIKSELNSDKFEYVIWGAGNGGKLANKIIKDKYKNSKFNGYIDKFKKGNKIYNPEQINNLEFDYIFIATTPGKLDAYRYLNNLNYEYISQYINLYN